MWTHFCYSLRSDRADRAGGLVKRPEALGDGFAQRLNCSFTGGHLSQNSLNC